MAEVTDYLEFKKLLDRYRRTIIKRCWAGVAMPNYFEAKRESETKAKRKLTEFVLAHFHKEDFPIE